MRALVIVAVSAMLAGCVTAAETVHFRGTNPQQQAIVRDGRPALVSRQKNSLVLVSPAGRGIDTGSRPVFVVAINNLSKQPVNFLMSHVDARQIVGGQQYPMQVLTYETLVQEEKNRQVAMAVLSGVAAGLNTYAASKSAGHGRFDAATYGPRGVYSTSGSFYDPTAAAIAMDRAGAQNEAMIASTIEQGQRNMAALERGVLKDNTLMPGEWYGGQLHLSPPTSTESGSKRYIIGIQVGADRHEIEVTQGRPNT